MKTNSQLNQLTVKRGKQPRFNPLSTLRPEELSRHLDAFDAGQLGEAAAIWEQLEQRDDLVRAVASKRKKAVARHGWTVLTDAGLSPAETRQAKEHAAALERFYRSARCEHAIDTAEQGGMKLLLRQMMDAIGKRFAVHEIVWRPGSRREGERELSATFRFVPLGFFENTTGRLRFLEHEGRFEGRELEPGAWMTTVGEGLMAATSAAWVYKQIALQDWLKYSEHNGRPGLRGISSAQPGSESWNLLQASLEEILAGGAVVHGSAEDIQVIDLTAGRSVPFPGLVERVDRLIATMWRGADLSTLSRDRGYGASLQERETCALEEDDAELLSETLHRYVDQWVIRYTFGDGVKPLARIRVLAAPRECTAHDLQVDEFLARHGAPLSLEETMHRYGRRPAEAGREIFGTGSTGTRRENPQARHEDMAMGNVVFPGESVPLPLAGDTAEPPPAETAGADLPNQFTLLQPDWVQLSPYGDFPHARGLQRVDREAAEGMVAEFNSFLARASRLFGGVPFYAGHPDLPGASECADRKAYGWVARLEARDDGLYGLVKWSEPGLELLRQGHYKFLSPYWEAKEAGFEQGRKVYRPAALISVGLTNQPNIPVRPLANAGKGVVEMAPMVASSEIGELIENALGEGRISPAEEADWRERLANQFGQAKTALAALPPRIHTRPATEALRFRRLEAMRVRPGRGRVQEAVRGKMREGLSYDEAWAALKEEKPAWFE